MAAGDPQQLVRDIDPRQGQTGAARRAQPTGEVADVQTHDIAHRRLGQLCEEQCGGDPEGERCQFHVRVCQAAWP
jgi:hypothetical protein